MSIKSTQEQLRSDHITTLELLQQCTNENIELKKELRKLKGQSADAKSVTNTTDEDPMKADMLDIVEKNTKQADEIKLLKSRINQVELDLMKSKQIQATAQHSTLQSMTEKAKKKKADMEKAVFELESHLRTANLELKAYSGIETLLHDLRRENSELVHKSHGLEQSYHEVCSLNDSLSATSSALHVQISSLQRDLEQSKQDNKRLESTTDQRLVDAQRLLAHQAEQNGILKKELSSQAEIAFQLQRENEMLVAERDAALSSHQKLLSSISGLNSEIARHQQSIVDLQRAESEEGGETFKFTATLQAATIVLADQVIEQTKPEGDERDASFRFQEFLRLKRENKELKMRLADMGSSGSTAHQPEVLAAVKSTSGSPRGSTKKQVGGGLPARTRNSTSQKVL